MTILSQAKSTTIAIPYRGIIETVAEHNTGKTLAMFQAVRSYEKTVFVDDDIKGGSTVKQLLDLGIEFEEYIDLAPLRSRLGTQASGTEILNKIVLPTVERITKTHHDVIIWDTWRIVYQSARMHVEKNQSLYSSVVTFRGTSEIIQGLISKVARQIERKILDDLRQSCDLLLVSHHLKDKWVKNVQIGLMPESSSTFDEVCTMRMWLRKNPASSTPIILFLKTPNIPIRTATGIEFQNIVPDKITPKAGEKTIWQSIARYEKEPFRDRSPHEDERLTPEEYAAISNTLTLEQRQYVMEMMKFGKEEKTEIASAMSGFALSGKAPENTLEFLSRAMIEYQLDATALEQNFGISPAILSGLKADDFALLWERISKNRETEER